MYRHVRGIGFRVVGFGSMWGHVGGRERERERGGRERERERERVECTMKRTAVDKD